MFGLVNGSSRLLWGYLMDKFGFKPLMSIIAGIEITLAGSFGGHFSILAPLFNKVYGVEIGPQAYGICGFFIGFSNLSGPLLCMFLLKKNTHFLIAFLFGGSLVLIKIFCLLMFDEEEKFNFDTINIDEDIGEITRESKNNEVKGDNEIKDENKEKLNNEIETV